VLRFELRLSRLPSSVVLSSSVARLSLSNSFSHDKITSGSIFFFRMFSWILLLFSSYSDCAFTYIFFVSWSFDEWFGNYELWKRGEEEEEERRRGEGEKGEIGRVEGEVVSRESERREKREEKKRRIEG
jgi:hypothetical protein